MAGAGIHGCREGSSGRIRGAARDWGRLSSAALTDPERECPELSAAAFQRFLKAANESDLTTRAHCRARLTWVLLALLALAGLAVLLARGRKEEAVARAAEFTRLQREVCRSTLPFTHRTPNELERLCPPRP
jgi:hypothetical protein